jgi:acyl-coenzyme A thioesterase PaaI-like protein
VKRKALAGALALVLIAAVILAIRTFLPTPPGPRSPERTSTLPVSQAELAPLRRVPFYRALIDAKALRSVTVDREGTFHVDADLRAALEPRLAAAGFPRASELLPAKAQGSIVLAEHRVRESWTFEPPAPLFELLDRTPAGTLGSPAMDSIPGAPSSMVCAQLMASRLADPELGGAALSSWRERVAFAEKLLGRPLRAELAEDLAGPAIFALYDTAGGNEAQAILSLELKRSDRMASLLDMVFALGALTEHGSVRRYRGVATGSFTPASGGPGLALAIDGPVLVVATSRERLESAIDARRAGVRHGGVTVTPSDPAASWSAVSSSAFVAHGWSRLLRSADEERPPGSGVTAEIRAEGSSGWRLTGEGSGPAITADPMLPLLRSAFARRQRAVD